MIEPHSVMLCEAEIFSWYKISNTYPGIIQYLPGHLTGYPVLADHLIARKVAMVLVVRAISVIALRIHFFFKILFIADA